MLEVVNLALTPMREPCQHNKNSPRKPLKGLTLRGYTMERCAIR